MTLSSRLRAHVCLRGLVVAFVFFLALTSGRDAFGQSADPTHGLDEILRRGRVKEYNLLSWGDYESRSERLVFHDQATSAEIWLMARHPDSYQRHHYSNMPCWTANGELILLSCTRGDIGGRWLLTADGERWRRLTSNNVQLDAVDPDLGYVQNASLGTIHAIDLRTGEMTLLWDLPTERMTLWPPSKDGRKLLVVENSQSSTAERSYAWLLNADGSGTPDVYDLGRVAHQSWFLKRPDYSFMFNDEASNIVNPYLDKQWICEPSEGGACRIFSDKHLSHAGVSPAGDRVAHHSGGARIIYPDTSEEYLVFSPGGGGHLSWEVDPSWFVATFNNTIYQVWPDESTGTLVCIPNTQLGYSTYNTEAHLESSPDGTKIGYASSMLGDGVFYNAVLYRPFPPRNVQLDGTTLSWEAPERAKELLGYNVYRNGQLLNDAPTTDTSFVAPGPAGAYEVTAVEWSGLESERQWAVTPEAPTNLRATALSTFTLMLQWDASPSVDVAYYNVYCSSSGTPEPVQARRVGSPAETLLMDWGLQGDTEYHYVVTAVNRQGVEGPAGAPLSVRTPAYDRYLQVVGVSTDLTTESFTEVPFSVPRDDTYVIWTYVRPIEGVTQLNTSDIWVHMEGVGPMRRWDIMYDYVCHGHGAPEPTPFFQTVKQSPDHGRYDARYNLTAGDHQIGFMMYADSVRLLSVVVTNDLSWTPTGITSFLGPRRGLGEQPSVWHCSPEGEGLGTSWDDTAPLSLGLLNAIANGDTVLLEEGTYPALDAGVEKSFTLRGGYRADGSGERDPEAWPSIVDAAHEYGAQVLRVGADGRGISDVEFDGVWFARGNYGFGGLIEIEEGSTSVTFRDCKFTSVGLTAGQTDLRRGGAVGIRRDCADIAFIDCDFISNRVAWHNTYSDYAGGGAVWSERCDGLTFDGCRFIDNSVRNVDDPDENYCLGGALALTGPGITIRDCVFEQNRVLQDGARNSVYQSGGGALYLRATPGTVVEGCRFTSNSAFGGGAVAIKAASAGTVIEDCHFEGNETEAGANSNGEGGALAAIDTGEVAIRGCYFGGNVTTTDGGALAFLDVTSGVVENCVVGDNAANRGGGVFLGDSSVDLDASVLERNSSLADGSAVYAAGANLTATRCHFRDHSTTQSGTVALNGPGAHWFESCLFLGNEVGAGDLAPGQFGAGLYSEPDATQTIVTDVVNCGFVANRANGSVGVIEGGGGPGNLTRLYNCLFSDNVVGPIHNYAVHNCEPLWHCYFYRTRKRGGAPALHWGGTPTLVDTQPSDPADVGVAPGFVDTVAGDYRLSSGSLAIDAGDRGGLSYRSTTDLGGKPRLADGDGNGATTIDIGPHETEPAPFEPTSAPNIQSWFLY